MVSMTRWNMVENNLRKIKNNLKIWVGTKNVRNRHILSALAKF